LQVINQALVLVVVKREKLKHISR